MNEINFFKNDLEKYKIPKEVLELKEKKIELIQDIRERYGILFVSTESREGTRQIGLKDDREWFRDALGLPVDSDRLKTIYALEENLPETVTEAGIIIGGSIYSVYEDLPWIRKLEEFIRIMHQARRPLLGVCFGHQLIAKIFGGEVKRNPRGIEFGNVSVDLAQEGAIDSLFEGISSQFLAPESHQDIISKLPKMEKTVILARNDISAYQALAYGKTTRSVQFHPEITPKILEKIGEALVQSGYLKREQYLKEFDNLQDTPMARQVLRNFDRNFVLKYHLKKK